jgi:hypothetical protein
MLTDQHFLPEESASDPKSQVSLQTSAELDRSCYVQVREIVDAIAATIVNAEAGLNWLRAEPPDLERVRQVLNSVAGDGKRAAENLARLRVLMKKTPTADGLRFLSSGS